MFHHFKIVDDEWSLILGRTFFKSYKRNFETISESIQILLNVNDASSSSANDCAVFVSRNADRSPDSCKMLEIMSGASHTESYES